MRANDVIKLLDLRPLTVEGGFFRETYRSALTVGPAVLGGSYDGMRAFNTAIYYLLTPDTYSAIHMLPSDEIFHFYLGDPVEFLALFPDGTSARTILGTELAQGMVPQLVVRGGTWQGSRLRAGGRFALLGTTVTPGFDYLDFHLGDAGELCRRFPDQAALIRALLPETRGGEAP